jgi:small subunit ribosomal protein S18
VWAPVAARRRRRWRPVRQKEGHELARKRKRERREKKDEGWQKRQRKKVCIFCRDHVDYVDFKDTGLLRRFISDRGKIRARRVTGTCSQHQRDVASAVKNAREMALLPYSTR